MSTGKNTAIEMENDVQWDFAESLRQIKKYRKNKRDFQKVVIIIPKKYERFARYYENEGFEVYLWEATWLWECADCETRIPARKTGVPKCTRRNCKSSDRVLVGLEDVSFEPFKER